MVMVRLFAIVVGIVSVSLVIQAQTPQRVPVTTGFSPGLEMRSMKSSAWIVDGDVVYHGTPDRWYPFPELYRCGPARIAFATDTLITVVADRYMASDTAWWMFTGDRFSRKWTDSVRLDAQGRFLCATKQHLLFSASDPNAEMVVEAFGRDGAIASTFVMPALRNTLWIMARMCGDSVIVSDQARGMPVYKVIRNVDDPVSTWVVDDLPDVRYGFVGENDAFVYQTENGVFLDNGGSVLPLAAMSDRLLDLFVDGRKGARIAQGGIEYMNDITVGSPILSRAQELLVSGTDRIMSLGWIRAIVWRTEKNLEFFREYVDASGATQTALVPAVVGSVSHGTRAMVSGDRVVIGEYLRSISGSKVVPSICDLAVDAGGETLKPLTEVATSYGEIQLRTVNDEVWAGTNDGTFTFPDYTRVSNRTAYDVVGGGDRVYMLTNRGIEVREGFDSTFRVFVDEQAPAGFAVAGDTLVVIRIEDITIDEPEARWVVDAYDRLGNVMFYGALLADSVVKSGLRWRSIVSTSFGLLINGQERLFRSVNGGASWTTVDPGVSLTTSLSSAEDRVCSWGIRPDGTEGPCLMISPDRWVMQPAVLRTPRPVIACAAMPGWFVFSTADGLYHAKQTISSVWESPLQGTSNIPDGAIPDETRIVDLMGRICDSQENLPSGLYVVTQRFGEIVRSGVRLVVK